MGNPDKLEKLVNKGPGTACTNTFATTEYIKLT